MPLLPVVPELVSDETLKRARTTITEGGEEKDAIRVTSVGGSGGLDSQGVADAMGMQASAVAQNSVLGYLASTKSALATNNVVTASVDNNSFMTRDWLGNKTDAAWSGTGSGTLNAVAKRISDDTHATTDVLGTTSDDYIESYEDGTISSRLKQISLDLYTINTSTIDAASNSDAILAYVGSSTDSAWSGTGVGTLIAVAKRTSNDTHSITDATGTQSDAAWSGSGDGSVIALLKGIYNKL